MTETNLIMEGIHLMLLGMGIVFSFLIMLVFALKAMSWFAQQLAPDPVPVVISAEMAPSQTESDEVLLAVVAAAVARFRQKH